MKSIENVLLIEFIGIGGHLDKDIVIFWVNGFEVWQAIMLSKDETFSSMTGLMSKKSLWKKSLHATKIVLHQEHASDSKKIASADLTTKERFTMRKEVFNINI